MRIIETEIEINSTQEKVWSILSDFENYHHWNPFCTKLETTKNIGDPVVMTVHLTPGKKPIIQKEILSDYKPPVETGWTLNWGIFLKTHRLQTLSTIKSGKTKYYTFDKFWGILTPLVMFLYRKDIQLGFDNTAKALKEFAEKK